MKAEKRIEYLDGLVDMLVKDSYGIGSKALLNATHAGWPLRSLIKRNESRISNISAPCRVRVLTTAEEQISKQALLDQMQKMQKVIDLLLDKLDVKVKTRDDYPEVQLVHNSDLKVNNEG